MKLRFYVDRNASASLLVDPDDVCSLSICLCICPYVKKAWHDCDEFCGSRIIAPWGFYFFSAKYERSR